MWNFFLGGKVQTHSIHVWYISCCLDGMGKVSWCFIDVFEGLEVLVLTHGSFLEATGSQKSFNKNLFGPLWGIQQATFLGEHQAVKDSQKLMAIWKWKPWNFKELKDTTTSSLISSVNILSRVEIFMVVNFPKKNKSVLTICLEDAFLRETLHLVVFFSKLKGWNHFKPCDMPRIISCFFLHI